VSDVRRHQSLNREQSVTKVMIQKEEWCFQSADIVPAVACELAKQKHDEHTVSGTCSRCH